MLWATILDVRLTKISNVLVYLKWPWIDCTFFHHEVRSIIMIECFECMMAKKHLNCCCVLPGMEGVKFYSTFVILHTFVVAVNACELVWGSILNIIMLPDSFWMLHCIIHDGCLCSENLAGLSYPCDTSRFDVYAAKVLFFHVRQFVMPSHWFRGRYCNLHFRWCLCTEGRKTILYVCVASPYFAMVVRISRYFFSRFFVWPCIKG